MKIFLRLQPREWEYIYIYIRIKNKKMAFIWWFLAKSQIEIRFA